MENSVAYDTRDRPLLATKGALLKFTQEYAGLLGDAAFVKHQVDVQVSLLFIIFNTEGVRLYFIRR